MKFSQLIEYKKGNIFLRNQADNEAARLVSDPFFFFKKKKALNEVKAYILNINI